MSMLEPITDMTGAANPIDVINQNIQQLIDEHNRSSDQLDTLTSAPSFAAYGNHTTTAVTLPSGPSNNSSNQFNFLHNLGYIPSYFCYVPGQADSSVTPPSGFSKTYYVAVVNTFQTFGSNLTYTWNVGIDISYFYLTLTLVNNSGGSVTSVPQTFYFYILSNPSTGLTL